MVPLFVARLEGSGTKQQTQDVETGTDGGRTPHVSRVVKRSKATTDTERFIVGATTIFRVRRG